MLEPAKIPLAKVRRSIVIWALTCCLIYIVLIFIFKFAGLLEVTGLRVLNYLVLFFVTFFGIRNWVRQTEHFVPFLTVFTTALMTGFLSFFLFAVFLTFYTRFDTDLTRLFKEHAPETLRSIPAAVVFFEGAAVSIIAAFINMQYFRRYEEGEVSPENKHKHSVDKP